MILLNLILDEYWICQKSHISKFISVPKANLHHPEILERVLSFQIQAHSLSTYPRGSLTSGCREVPISLTCRECSVNSCMAHRPGLDKLAWACPLDLCQCCLWDFRNISQCSPELWCTNDLFSRKEKRPALLCKQRKLT